MHLKYKKFITLFLGLIAVMGFVCTGFAEWESLEQFQESAAYPKFLVDNLWLLIAAGLVFVMHLGFATLESGLTQSKNTVNILFKNVFIICMGTLAYAIWGFNSMYPGDNWIWDGVIGKGGPIPDATQAVGNLTSDYADYTLWTDFIFQAMFAATAATIISGAVAERHQTGELHGRGNHYRVDRVSYHRVLGMGR